MKIGKNSFNKLILSALCLVAFGCVQSGYAGHGSSKPLPEEQKQQPAGDEQVAVQEEKNTATEKEDGDGKIRETDKAVGSPAVPIYHFEVSEDGKNVTIGDSTPERISITSISKEYAEEIVRRLQKNPRQSINFNNVRFDLGAFAIIGRVLDGVDNLTITGYDSDDKGAREVVRALFDHPGVQFNLNFDGVSNLATGAFANLDQKNRLIRELVAEINTASPDDRISFVDFDVRFMGQGQVVLDGLTESQVDRIYQVRLLRNQINMFLYARDISSARRIDGILLCAREVPVVPSTTRASRAVSAISNALGSIGSLKNKVTSLMTRTPVTSSAVGSSSSSTNSTSISSTATSSSSSTTATPEASSSSSSVNEGIVTTDQPVATTVLPGMLSRVNMSNMIGSAFRTVGTPFVYIGRGAVAIGNAAATVARVTRNAAVTAVTTTGSAVATAARWVVGVPGRVGHGIAERFRRAPSAAQNVVQPMQQVETPSSSSAPSNSLSPSSTDNGGIMSDVSQVSSSAPSNLSSDASSVSANDNRPSLNVNILEDYLSVSTNDVTGDSSETQNDVPVAQSTSSTNDATGSSSQAQNVVPVAQSTTLRLDTASIPAPAARRSLLSMLWFGGSKK